MKDYFRDLKPILNKLSELNVYDSLDVVRQYIKQSTDDKLNFAFQDIDRPQYAKINLYYADFLIANILKYAKNQSTLMSLRLLDTRKKICFPIAKIQDDLNSQIIEGNNFVFTWLNSYIFNQVNIKLLNIFPILFYRYYYLCCSSNIKKYVENILGIKLDSYFKMTLYLYVCFNNNHFYYSKEKLFGPYLTSDNITALEYILNKISLPLKNISKLCHDTCQYKGNLMFNFYSDSPHIKYPLICEDNGFYCVVPNYILETLLVGLYFVLDIPNCTDEDLTKEFSHNFETYVGNIFSYYFTNTSIHFMPEITYNIGKSKDLKTSDWILWNETHIVFLDCKLKRISIKGKGATEIKVDLIDDIINHNYFSRKQIKEHIEKSIPEGITKDLIDLGIGLGKIFVCYDTYKQNKIEKLKYKGDKIFCAILLTLEEGFCNSLNYKEQIIRIAQAYRNYKGESNEIINPDEVKIFSIRDIENEIPILAKDNSLVMLGGNNKKCIINDYLMECFENKIMKPLLKEMPKQLQHEPHIDPYFCKYR